MIVNWGRDTYSQSKHVKCVNENDGKSGDKRSSFAHFAGQLLILSCNFWRILFGACPPRKQDVTPRATNEALQILLVEDDEIDVENVQRAFANTDPPSVITVARDGRQALDLLASRQIPTDNLLILLDLNMPRMNGIEFLQALRADDMFNHLPVVVLTTSDAEPDKVSAHNLNVAGYMLKPITFDDFVTTLDAVETYWRLQECP